MDKIDLDDDDGYATGQPRDSPPPCTANLRAWLRCVQVYPSAMGLGCTSGRTAPNDFVTLRPGTCRGYHSMRLGASLGVARVAVAQGRDMESFTAGPRTCTPWVSYGLEVQYPNTPPAPKAPTTPPPLPRVPILTAVMIRPLKASVRDGPGSFPRCGRWILVTSSTPRQSDDASDRKWHGILDHPPACISISIHATVSMGMGHA
ncbi:hypothetical protein Micbo1qcDRAFT_173958 [Microdochium bolleyi]|uniref:Uncharacterized protein n=1 Tax=Microdochium bolleyi TaxID=196109 RepID=A0A136J6N6_9PEZI|nr:hypothetical protein Micbo1qcDRAFT_173958 [Microdochium bolleyi]